MTDEQREAMIRTASAESQAASNNGDRPLARYWLREMEKLINGRSAAQVARMETKYFTKLGQQDAVAQQAKAVDRHA